MNTSIVNTSITKQELKQEMEKATACLLDLARASSYNKISENFVFLLSEIKNDGIDSNAREKLNDKKTPGTIDEILPALLDMYMAIYDINLYVYKSVKEQTIVEIQYYFKNSLDDVHRKGVEEKDPMIHCKVMLPSYVSTSRKKKKFDINWEHNTFSHRWNMFWLRIKFQLRQLPGK